MMQNSATVISSWFIIISTIKLPTNFSDYVYLTAYNESILCKNTSTDTTCL